MACCAFALFCVFWLTAPFRRLARRFGRQPRIDAAVLWSPGMARVRAPRLLRPATVGVGLGMVGAGVLALSPVVAAAPGHGVDRSWLAERVGASICGGWQGGK